jgi:uncharacterized protein
MSLVLRLLEGELAILRLAPDAGVPSWLNSGKPLVSVTRTVDELSIVCPACLVPDGAACEAGWRAFRVEGKMDFSAVGILAAVLNPLAQAGISIFAISTFDTDYILVRGDALERALTALRGHFEVLE